MAAVLPRNLALIVQRLSNFNRTTIRVRAQSNDTASAGQTISFRLPTNTLIDLHNLQLTGRVRAWYKGQGDKYFSALMPRHTNQMFERIDVVVNGQVITGNNTDYAALDHLMRMNKEEGFSGSDTTSRPGAWLTDGSIIPRHKRDPISGASNAPVDTAAGIEAVPFACNQFLGFLGGDYVRFIDTAVLGPVEIRFRLHAPSILGVHPNSNVGKDAVAASDHGFEVSDLYMMLDTVSFSDDFYRAILAKRLMEGGIIQIPYMNYFSVNKTVSAQGSEHLTFNIASQSIDYLLATFRSSNYNSSSKIAVYGGLSSRGAAGAVQDTMNSAYLTCRGSTTAELQFMVNNMLAPTWPASFTDQYLLTRAAFDHTKTHKCVGRVRTEGDYLDRAYSFVQCFKHHVGHDSGDMIISGLDTRGASSNMALLVKGMGPASSDATVGWNATVFALCTSTLEISAGQNIVTIF